MYCMDFREGGVCVFVWRENGRKRGQREKEERGKERGKEEREGERRECVDIG